MRIGMSKGQRRINRAGVNLTSMIDVVFLLLVYFIVTTVISIPEDRLAPALQQRESKAGGAKQDLEPQIVEVVAEGGTPVYRFGDRVMTARGELAAVLAGLPQDPGLFIKVSDGVPIGFAIAALQEARNAGFEKVTYVPAGD